MSDNPVTDNPVLSAMEAYRRTHPRQADAVDEAMVRGPVDEDSDAVLSPEPSSGGTSGSPGVAASEQLPLMAPDPADRRWIARSVTQFQIAQAKTRMDRVTAESGLTDPGGRHFTPKTNWLWVGFLVENEVESWLLRRGVEHTRYGGVRDQRPDFVLGETGLGIKSASMTGALRAREYSGGPGPALAFLWPHSQPVPDYALFSYYDPSQATVYLCGVAAHDAIVEAPVLLKGEIAYASQRAGTDFYRVPEAALMQPDDWLAAR